MQNKIKIDSLTKKYDDNKGNFNINISLVSGETYGIIGPNGAGKTTLMRLLMGFLRPDLGKISIENLDPIIDHSVIMQFIGYLPGEVDLYEDMKAESYLKSLSKLKNNVEWDFVKSLIKYFDLDTKIKIKKMSKGTKQKVAIIAAFMNKPSILFLDEPTSGLDPLMQEKFDSLIKKFKKEGSTIIIASHIIHEVITLCDKVGFIKNGKIIKEYSDKEINFDNLSNEFKCNFINEKELEI